MPENTAQDPSSNWIPLARQLVHAVSSLFEQHTLHNRDAYNDDFRKLLEAAEKLEAFSNRSPSLNSQKLWHELRNLVGTIMGYSELIMEECLDGENYEEQVQSVLMLCNQLLSGDSQTVRSSLPQQNKSRPQGPTGTVLIVDDQQASREILSRYLQQDQHQVLEAESGNQMFSMLQQHNVDVILLDLILPEMHGDELLEQLKGDDKLRAIPVIVVSGSKETERVIHCIEAGAEDYLFKPFNPTLLQARIIAGIERKRWHDKEALYRTELERNQRFIRQVFGRYLSEEIVNNLLENPDGLDMGGVQRTVTILMADICGFTPIAEQLSPQRVVRLLNNYLGTMSDIIMAHNGTVDEFIGDAILAIFGAPISREDDAERALRCALEMQAAVDSINRQNRQEGLPEIRIGISVNTGPVVAGNIGSEKRSKYGIVGHTVNQTARIEEQCGADTILFSDGTLEACEALLCISDSRTLQAKGIDQAFQIYQLCHIETKT